MRGRSNEGRQNVSVSRATPVFFRIEGRWVLHGHILKLNQRLIPPNHWDLENCDELCAPSGVIKHGLLENGPFIGDGPSKTSIHRGFSIAMFDYQRVNSKSTLNNSSKMSDHLII